MIFLDDKAFSANEMRHCTFIWPDTNWVSRGTFSACITKLRAPVLLGPGSIGLLQTDL